MSSEVHEKTLSNGEHGLLIVSLIGTQELAVIHISREDAERAVDQAWSEPMIDLGRKGNKRKEDR